MENVQHNAAEHMSQLVLSYRESLLSVRGGNSGELRAGDRVPDLPVTLLHSEGSGFAHEKLRASASPFLDEATKNLLAQSKRKVLVIGGFATEAVVLHAVLDARVQGYEVLVPMDVCGGMSARTEQAALRQIIAAGAITTSVVSIATKLAPDFTTDLGKDLFDIVQRLRLT
jgi:hypothetical protein